MAQRLLWQNVCARSSMIGVTIRLIAIFACAVMLTRLGVVTGQAEKRVVS
jgi:hypothetical protein